MEQSDLERLHKIELRAKELFKELFDLDVPEIYFDIVDDEKMMEIMAYGFPTNLSWWAHGRDYERMRTIHDHADAHLPYEVVLFGDPYRAFLMKSNTFAVQVLVMVHVMAHCIVFENSQWFKKTRKDLIQVLSAAAERLNEYETIYGIDEIETIVDAGRSLEFHSNPFSTETEEEKKKRVFENQKKILRNKNQSEFSDINQKSTMKIISTENFSAGEIDQYNYQLWRLIQRKTPIEPTEDILRFVIDNSKYLEDWQKDILEIIRMEGQYYWPIIRTKYLNEGAAVYFHEKIINKLFEENYMTSMEHGQYNYSNSLVKAQSRVSMNPYLIGSELLKSVEDRWNKGQHGIEYENCTDWKVKENWDTHEMKGLEKVKEVIKTYTDWMLMQEFLTPKLIEKLDLYIYLSQEYADMTEYIRTEHTPEQIKNLIISCFAESGIPKIEVIRSDNNQLILQHKYSGVSLDRHYCEETMKHICRLWGNDVFLNTEINNKKVLLKVAYPKTPSEINVGLLTFSKEML